jgi:hypothetical protein
MENARKSRTRVRLVLGSLRRAAERAMAAAMLSPPVTHVVKDITVERRFARTCLPTATRGG